MLPLTDPKWRNLKANYTDGSRVAELLVSAGGGAPAEQWYEDLFQELCHQYTVSEAAFFAAPHLARIAAARPDVRKDLLILLASCHASARSPEPLPIPAESEGGWRSSAAEGLPMLASLLARPPADEDELRYLLSSLAALQGYADLALAIEGLDDR